MEINLIDNESLNKCAELFKVFSDATRVKILCVISNRELSVNDIASTLAMNQSAISHQLKTLKNNKLIKSRRDGKTIYYSLNDDCVKNIISQGIKHSNEIIQ